MQWLARICSLPLALLALAAAWLAVAPFTPRIPYWGAGSLISPEYIGPVLLISLAVLAVSAALSFASKANVVPATVAALAAVASGALLATQVAGAREMGTDVDVAAALSWDGLEKTDRGPDATVAYDTHDGDDLDVDVYEPDAGGNHPVLLYVHGGGWNQMNRHSQAYNMRAMADAGYVVASIDYTLARPGYLGGTPDGVPERADFVTSANHVTDASQPTMIVRSDHDRLVPPASYDAFRAAAREHGVALTEQVRRHADHASALSAHGVWNQNLLATMQRFFAENGADA